MQLPIISVKSRSNNKNRREGILFGIMPEYIKSGTNKAIKPVTNLVMKRTTDEVSPVKYRKAETIRDNIIRRLKTG